MHFDYSVTLHTYLFAKYHMAASQIFVNGIKFDKHNLPLLIGVSFYKHETVPSPRKKIAQLNLQTGPYNTNRRWL